MYQGNSLRDRAVAVMLVSALVAGGLAFAEPANLDLPSFTLQGPASEVTAMEAATTAAAGAAAPERVADPLELPKLPAADLPDESGRVELLAAGAAGLPWDRQPGDEYITFVTPYSEEVVRTFELRCPHSDKSIRLIDSMRIGLRQIASMGGGHLHMTADSRGKEVRIYNQMRLKDGRSNSSRLSISIDEWGELQTHGIDPTSIYVACDG